MTMSFLLHDSLNEIETAEMNSPHRVNGGGQSTSPLSRVTILEEKLKIPLAEGLVSRPRLLELLDRSIEQYGATLISGRAGTGKTTLAAEYARQARGSSWYTIEPADLDWREFSASFSASLFGTRRPPRAGDGFAADPAGISSYLAATFGKLAKRKRKTPKLIVLDNVHHLFDAPWFGEFFRQLIVSLDENARLLMLCRSKPTAPLWRLRSKQMLNVIDENMLDLSDQEARAIGKMRGVANDASAAALKRSFGRIGTFLKYLPQGSDQ